jgi:F420-0:gamma-glutamyl ligase-like protein
MKGELVHEKNASVQHHKSGKGVHKWNPWFFRRALCEFLCLFDLDVHLLKTRPWIASLCNGIHLVLNSCGSKPEVLRQWSCEMWCRVVWCYQCFGGPFGNLLPNYTLSHPTWSAVLNPINAYSRATHHCIRSIRRRPNMKTRMHYSAYTALNIYGTEKRFK